MSAAEISILITSGTGSLLAIIAAIFAGLASMRAGTARDEVAKVVHAVDDPVTGLKPLHDLSNSNFSKLAEDRDKEREGREALVEEVARLNKAAVDLAASALASSKEREAPPSEGK